MSTLRLPAIARESCRDESHRASFAALPIAATCLQSAAVLRHTVNRSRHTLAVMAEIMMGQWACACHWHYPNTYHAISCFGWLAFSSPSPESLWFSIQWNWWDAHQEKKRRRWISSSWWAFLNCLTWSTHYCHLLFYSAHSLPVSYTHLRAHET